MTPDCSRLTVRCIHCALNQFVLDSLICRRCHLPVNGDSPELPPPPGPITPIDLLPLPDKPQPYLSDPVFWLPFVVYDMRMRAGMSQRRLAHCLESPRTYISKIENFGNRITVATLLRLCAVLGQDPGHVMLRCEHLAGVYGNPASVLAQPEQPAQPTQPTMIG